MFHTHTDTQTRQYIELLLLSHNKAKPNTPNIVISNKHEIKHTAYLLFVSVAPNSVFGAVPPSASLNATLGVTSSTAGGVVFAASGTGVGTVAGSTGGTRAGGASGGVRSPAAPCTTGTSGCWAPEVATSSSTEQRSGRQDIARVTGWGEAPGTPAVLLSLCN